VKGTDVPNLVISKTFDFEAAHQLPYHAGKCSRPHGHSYKLRVSLMGHVEHDNPSNPSSGMVMDFGDMKTIVKPLIDDFLDHHDLNDVMENPTAENILLWIVERLKYGFGAMLVEVTLWETATCSATWRKDLHG
jgi:6-pyruvoyltetrahydropterin/6-carboxytetrahydropterin synthase